MPKSNVTIKMDDNLKKQAEILFEDMGLNMTTALTLFVKASVKQGKIPFEIQGKTLSAESIEAMEDARLNRNLHGPYASAREAVEAMLED